MQNEAIASESIYVSSFPCIPFANLSPHSCAHVFIRVLQPSLAFRELTHAFPRMMNILATQEAQVYVRESEEAPLARYSEVVNDSRYVFQENIAGFLYVYPQLKET